MRWVNLAVIILFAVSISIFAVQNLETVTVTFLAYSLRAPFAVLVFGVYVLGALTGGNLFAVLRRSYDGTRGR